MIQERVIKMCPGFVTEFLLSVGSMVVEAAHPRDLFIRIKTEVFNCFRKQTEILFVEVQKNLPAKQSRYNMRA